MNRNGLAAASLLSVVPSFAFAQRAPLPGEVATVILTHDDADGEINVGDTVTWTLKVGFTGFVNFAAASGMNAAIIASSPTLVTSSDIAYTDVTNQLNGIGALGGYNGGDSNGSGGFDFVSFTNSLFIEAFGNGNADRSNPFIVGTFTTTALNPGQLDYTIGLGLGPHPFVIIDNSAFEMVKFLPTEVLFEIDTLTIVPAPASGLLLVPASLLATRRRR